MQRAPLGHRVPRIGHEVQQDLLHRGGVGFDHAGVLVGHELHLDVAGKPAPHGIEGVAHELGEDQRLQVERAVAAEAEEPLRQLGAALSGVPQRVEVAVRRQRLGQRGRARQDGGEELVELLSDGAREPADHLHLFGLLQRPLARELRGDVLGGHSALLIVRRLGAVKASNQHVRGVARPRRPTAARASEPGAGSSSRPPAHRCRCSPSSRRPRPYPLRWRTSGTDLRPHL